MFLIPPKEDLLTVRIYRPQNGEITIIIPGKLVFFNPPDPTLPHGTQWRDVGDRRVFSPVFLADLLQHLQISHVLRLDGPHDDTAALEERGILTYDLEDLGASTAEDLCSLQALFL